MHSSNYKDFPPPPSKKVLSRKPSANSTLIQDVTSNKTKSTVAIMKKKPHNQTLQSRNVHDVSIRPGNNQRNDDNKETDDLTKKLAYNDFIESLFLETLVDEKIEREKTEIDYKLAELAKRLEINRVFLDSTNARLKDISFLSEQQRILDEKDIDREEFLKQIEDAETIQLLDGLIENEDYYCNRLHMKNVDIGYREDTAFSELKSAINQTVESLDRVKAECSLSTEELKSMGRISAGFEDCEKTKDQLEKNLKECEKILPKVSINVIDAVSDQLANILS